MDQNYHDIAENILTWFQEFRRCLPWRSDRTPYRVLVSEIMLQQTQVLRVISYFNRWMDKFPTLEALAAAPVEDVIKTWEGLGYYSRARSLKKAAEYIVSQLDGVVPNTREKLEEVPGVGPYTSGAIMSFAFQIPTPAIDANVLRVISRIFDIHEPIPSKGAKKEIESHVAHLLQTPSSCPDLMEAFIELGALVCTSSKPDCYTSCPVYNSCLAFQRGTVDQVPVKIKKRNRERLLRTVFVIYSTSTRQYLIIERRGKKLMAGLHEFPFIELDPTQNQERLLTSRECEKVLTHLFSQEITIINTVTSLCSVQHSFTRFQAVLQPVVCVVEKPFDIQLDGDMAHWLTIEKASNLPFSSGHKKIWEEIITNLKKERSSSSSCAFLVT